MEYFFPTHCAAAVQKDINVSYILFTNSSITAGPVLYKHLRALTASNYAHSFWEWSYSTSDHHDNERNGNGVLYEMT